MSNYTIQLKEQHTLLKKEYFDLSQDYKQLKRDNMRITDQAYNLMKKVEAEIQVYSSMLEHSQVDIELLRHEVIDIKLQLLKDRELRFEIIETNLLALKNEFKNEIIKMREQLPHELLTVWKLLSLKSMGQLDNRLFDATAEEFESYIANHFEVTLLQARTIRLLFQEWK